MVDILIRKVSKRYGRQQVVHGIDLAVGAGEFVVILGPSGCGKSTLLRMIAGLEEISDGEIALGGRVVNRLEPRERGCAMVFQNYALYPHMTVAENIGYGLKVAGVGATERRERVTRVATTVGLESFLDRKPGQLSGGQRQRVAMARAMIREPSIFLFDEPLSNLDARLRVQMRIEIRKLHNRLGVTSVFVTHDQTEAMTLADRLVVMNAGRIEQVGTPEEVYSKPASRFVASFVGSPPMNLVEARVSPSGDLLVGGIGLSATCRLEPGRTVLVGIRPEDVVIGERGELMSEIDFVEDLGALRLLHGRVNGTDFVVQVPSTGRRANGPLTFSVPPDRLHLFDAGTGLRLDSPSGAASAAA
jgi:sn-glycerol 3-phosphate transport system ATP-binding protein